MWICEFHWLFLEVVILILKRKSNSWDVRSAFETSSSPRATASKETMQTIALVMSLRLSFRNFFIFSYLFSFCFRGEGAQDRQALGSE